MILIDGSLGEGGGQVLRTTVGLAAHTGQAVRVENIRAGREKPGLLRQHLTAARAAAEICGGALEGDALGSTTLTFVPGPVRNGSFTFDIGSAGSATLVVQTVLPALLAAPGPSTLRVRGGTHNKASPPFHALEGMFFAALRAMGADVRASLGGWGFYPAGGGEVIVEVHPGPLRPAVWDERGPIAAVEAVAVVAGDVRIGVARREIAAIREIAPEAAGRVEVVASVGPGNAAWVRARCSPFDAVFTGFGAWRKPAEAVGAEAADAFVAWRDAAVPVDEHLADQLLIPLALAGGGRFRTTRPSLHTTTNAEVISRLLPVTVSITEDEGAWSVAVSAR
jgi:RNA 3'-terminal phosphate cyclase (ATP)